MRASRRLFRCAHDSFGVRSQVNITIFTIRLKPQAALRIRRASRHLRLLATVRYSTLIGRVFVDRMRALAADGRPYAMSYSTEQP